MNKFNLSHEICPICKKNMQLLFTSSFCLCLQDSSKQDIAQKENKEFIAEPGDEYAPVVSTCNLCGSYSKGPLHLCNYGQMQCNRCCRFLTISEGDISHCPHCGDYYGWKSSSPNTIKCGLCKVTTVFPF